MKRDFAWQSSSKVIFGTGTVELLPQEVKRLGGGKVLILTDSGILKAGLVEKVKNCLGSKIAVDVYSDVQSEPNVKMVEICAELVRANGYDLLIGLGGGEPD